MQAYLETPAHIRLLGYHQWLPGREPPGEGIRQMIAGQGRLSASVTRAGEFWHVRADDGIRLPVQAARCGIAAKLLQK